MANNQLETTSALFDAKYYLQQNPDVAAAGVDPWQHYLTYGFKEGRNPDEYFNTKYYMTQNPDVASAGVNPLVHYDMYGWKESRKPSTVFDTSYYLKQNPDVAQAGIDPLVHYMQYGKNEGRLAVDTPKFNIEVDYSRYDKDGFFLNHPERQAVVEEACKVWENIFNDEFEDIPIGTTIQVLNPDTGLAESVVLTQPIDDLRIYMGSFNNTTTTLGYTRLSATSSTGNAKLDARYNSYDNIEPWVGSVAINDQYAQSLYFDHTPNDTTDDKVPTDKYDFLHILVHEFGHVLGMGPQNAGSQYATNVNGVEYFGGPHVKAVYGGAVPLDFASGTHFAANATMDAIMKPSLSYGTRVMPTALDKAFFADIGYVLR